MIQATWAHTARYSRPNSRRLRHISFHYGTNVQLWTLTEANLSLESFVDLEKQKKSNSDIVFALGFYLKWGTYCMINTDRSTCTHVCIYPPATDNIVTTQQNHAHILGLYFIYSDSSLLVYSATKQQCKRRRKYITGLWVDTLHSF